MLVLFFILIVLWVSRDLGGAGGWGNIFKSKYVCLAKLLHKYVLGMYDHSFVLI